MTHATGSLPPGREIIVYLSVHRQTIATALNLSLDGRVFRVSTTRP